MSQSIKQRTAGIANNKDAKELRFLLDATLADLASSRAEVVALVTDVGALATALDVLAAKLTPDQYQGYLQGSVLKYILRSNYKGNRSEDIKKAQWYLNTLVETYNLNEGE